jgi:drug/metabolite transporter (DMT)-like permease
MEAHHLSIVVAFVAYSLMDLGKAVQKQGLATVRKSRRRGLLIWAAGSVSTSVSSFLLLYAVSLTSIVVVGAMAGTGLASLALFSALVLKEKVGPRELAGIAAILAAPFLLVSVYPGAQATRPVVDHLFLMMAGVLGGYGLVVLVLTARRLRTGVVVASAAGSLGGFTLIFQKVSTSELGRASSFVAGRDLSAANDGLASRILLVLANPFTLLWIALSIIATLILQLSYRREAAIRVVPAFGLHYILIPVLGGLLFFREPFYPLQWLGIGLILLGAFLLLSSTAQDPTTPRDTSDHGANAAV